MPTSPNNFGVNIYKNADDYQITAAAEELLQTQTVKFESNKYNDIPKN